MLRQQAEYLQQSLQGVQERIKDLESKVAEEEK